MAAVGFCGLKPLLFRRKTNIFELYETLSKFWAPFITHSHLQGTKGSSTPKKSSKSQSKANGESLELSFVGADQLILMVEIHKKILAFRDIMDLAPCNNSDSLREILMRTLQDVQGLYPGIIPRNEVLKIKDKPIDQAMAYFCKALRSLGESWMMNNDWMDKLNIVMPSCKDNSNMRQLGETMVATLDCLMKLASERFDIEEDDQKKEFSPRSSSFGKFIMRSSSFSDGSFSGCSSPSTPRSVLPELMRYSSRGDSPRSSCASPLLLSLRVQAVGKLNPIDVKRLSFHMSPTHIHKTEDESTGEIEVDDKTTNHGKDSSEDLVFHLDTTEESNSTSDDHKKTAKPQAMGEVDLPLSPRQLQQQSHEPAQTPLLQASVPASLSPSHLSSPLPIPTPSIMAQPKTVPQPPPPPMIVSKAVPAPPPPPMIVSKTVPTPPPPPPPPSMLMPKTVTIPTTPVVKPNVAMPPPPPPSVPKLEQSAATVRMPPPPPPPMPLSSGSTATVLAPPPPPPLMPLKGGSVPAPPPPMPRGGNGGAPPPPPPLGAGRSLRPKATSKLKRSTQIGNLYRTLKGKVEGSSLPGKSSAGRKGAIGGGSTGGKQGMADALAEMTKRSSYFQQIEEDVQKYTTQIIELRSSITNFKTKEMPELIKFHKQVESVLENLTDESQVLSRFEGFPTKKLEAIRMSTALYNKLDSILTELQNWKIVPPMGQLLDKIERYFNKIKTDLDALERTKDEESKKFKGHNIEFDFHILIKIKEALVDVSSNCMELALKEKRTAAKSDGPKKEGAAMLWKAFQFAFRVYTFAGGHDDRADNLTRELAQEIESDPNHP
ncbi:uncharacterized protein At4g04980-like [Abrus precatorius]|uniref:Uncharacterized protein At4g04980-like n=1 Tax=Abrus precatorius TaxID=3816 RepID=A0A8B8KWM4_ABRPR|nr:uncharacterized protein At4g04980-like [Abrus precatorius]